MTVDSTFLVIKHHESKGKKLENLDGKLFLHVTWQFHLTLYLPFVCIHKLLIIDAFLDSVPFLSK